MSTHRSGSTTVRPAGAVEGPIADGLVPKHEQLRTRLAEVAARLPAGAPLPGERQLCDRYAVSRITVREAIGQLVADGVLIRVRGKGTFVAERPTRSRLHLASFHEDMRRSGRTPTTVVLAVDRVVPPARTRAALHLADHQPAWHVRRLRLADGQPMSLDDAWYPVAVAPDLGSAELTGSLYSLLRDRYATVIDRAEQTVRSAPADRATATVLGLAPGGAVLVVDRVAYAGTRTVEHAVSTYRGDRYELSMSVAVEPEA